MEAALPESVATLPKLYSPCLGHQRNRPLFVPVLAPRVAHRSGYNCSHSTYSPLFKRNLKSGSPQGLAAGRYSVTSTTTQAGSFGHGTSTVDQL
eukprot:3312865-Rhodomonas_salina.1